MVIKYVIADELMLADVQATMPEPWFRIGELRRETTPMLIKRMRGRQTEDGIRSGVKADLPSKVIHGNID